MSYTRALGLGSTLSRTIRSATLVRSGILRRFDRPSGFLTPPNLTLRTALSRHSPSNLTMPQLY